MICCSIQIFNSAIPRTKQYITDTCPTKLVVKTTKDTISKRQNCATAAIAKRNRIQRTPRDKNVQPSQLRTSIGPGALQETVQPPQLGQASRRHGSASTVWLRRWHTYAHHIGPIRRTQAWTKSATMLQKSWPASCVKRLRTAAAVASI